MLALEKLHSVTSQKPTVSSPTHSKGRSMASHTLTHSEGEGGWPQTYCLASYIYERLVSWKEQMKGLFSVPTGVRDTD